MENLISQFAGGDAEAMSGSELHGNVGQMLETAPPEHANGAVSEALSSLGPGGFGQSIQQAATDGGPQQRGGIANMLMGAIQHGGGSPTSALQELGMGGQDPQNLSPDQLGTLGRYVHSNHGSGLAGMLGGQLGGGQGGGGGMLSLLGNPMVRQVGMQLAKKLM